MTKVVEFIEIDIDYCSLDYAVPPCMAPAGQEPCFNTKSTCKARPSFQQETVTLRFAKGAAYLKETGIDYVAACVESINYSPGEVSLGENLGKRSNLSVTFSDFPHNDTGVGFDKYYEERDYDPYHTGTFWGKFRARHPYIRGRSIRWIKGHVGQSLGEMETRHFLMDSFDGPSLSGEFQIVAKDTLKLADDDRVKAPVASRGFLLGDITDTQTSVTMGPAGIGNLEYPTSGYINIAGKEIVSFTRSGDTLTLTRGQEGTVPVAHRAQDRLQLCLRYSGEDPADIIYDLLVNYAKVPAQYISLPTWKDETSLFLRRLYSRTVAEPTGVSKLVSELIEQAGLMVWWDDTTQLINLRVMRQIPTDAERFDERNILVNTLGVQEKPESRVSQVITYFGKRTPLERETEPTSYHSVQYDVNIESEDDYGDSIVKTIHSSWIPQFGRTIAQRLNEIVLGRFVDPPRLFTFATPRSSNILLPQLGGGYRLLSRNLQTGSGLPEDVPIQITRINPTDAGFSITAREMHFVDFSDEDLDSRVIVIDGNFFNFNWRQAYDQLYPPPTPDDDIICIIAAGAIVGSQVEGRPAFEVGSWPSGINLDLRIQGRIQGLGGTGGRGTSARGEFVPAKPGNTALYTRYPVAVTQSNQIWGGGGGGGGANDFADTPAVSGGGGSGFLPGGVITQQDGTQPTGGSTAAGGSGGFRGGLRAGNGGNPGQPGQAGQTGLTSPSGAAGRAIDGNSYVTFTAGQGDIRGPRVN